MRLFYWVAAMLAAVVVLAGTTTGALVFVDGSRLDDVQAELKTDLVWVTLANGAMQAYPVEEVDLEASGLLAEPMPVPEEVERERPEMAGGVRLSDARAKSIGTSAMKITDSDVEHISPEELAAEEGPGAGTDGPLTISNVKHKRLGDRIQVTGVVTNTTYDAIANARIDATAVDAEGASIGSGQRVLGRTIRPQERASFSVDIIGLGIVADVRVQAHGAAAEGPPRARPQAKTPTGPPRGRAAGRGGEEG